MLRQTTSKFENHSKPSNNVFFKHVEIEQPKTKIVDVQLNDDCPMTDGVLIYGTFKVECDGFYSLQNQLCVRQNGIKSLAHFLQFGVCDAELLNYETNFNSLILNSVCLEGYLLTNNLTTVLELKKDREYCCWTNFSAVKFGEFSYVKDLSHLKLYKLC